jgi:hypothetical protein
MDSSENTQKSQEYIFHAKFCILAAVTVMSFVVRDVVQCSLVHYYQRLVFYFEDEAAGASDVSIKIY